MLGTKTITVVLTGTGEKNEVPVTPQTEVRDVLEQLHLRDYQLSAGQNTKPLGERQLPFVLCSDREVLYATPKRMEPAI